MEITTSTDIHLQFVGEHSEEIFSRKEHVLVGISPCNSYYSKERIERILIWILEQGFQDFHFFLTDQMYYYNFLALGYSEKEALQKTKIKDNQLRNKALQVLAKFGFSEQKILKFSDLQKSPIYKNSFASYKNNLITDPAFCQIIHQIFKDLQMFKQIDFNVNFAMEYLFCEIPILLNTSELLHIQSSICVYHQNNNLYSFLYEQKKMQINTQGCLILKF